jgi:hypothetical protein
VEPKFCSGKTSGLVRSLKSTGDQIDRIIQNGNPLVLDGLDRMPGDPENSAKGQYISLLRVLSGLGNSVIIISDLDPLAISSIGE